MRILIALVLLAAVAGPAAADPLATVAVGPDGVGGAEMSEYYVAAEAGDVEGPRDSTSGTDACDPDAAERVNELVQNPPDPFTFHSLTPYTPTCIAVTAPCPGPPVTCSLAYGANFTYDITTGRYFVDAEVDPGAPPAPKKPIKTVHYEETAGGVPIPLRAGHGLDDAISADLPDFPQTGRTGVAIRTDCEGCPPICC